MPSRADSWTDRVNGVGAKTVVTGNPVRPAVIEAAKPYQAPASDQPFHLLVFGGSQGAQFFSDAVPAGIKAAAAGRSRQRLDGDAAGTR